MTGDNKDERRVRKEVSQEIYARTTLEQFAALGRFVQEFEELVTSVRSNCLWLLPVRTIDDQPLLNVLLHHPVMTAMPLFDCMRALYGALLEQSGDLIDPEEALAVRSILRQSTSSMQKLAGRRNSLLHGYWLIGRHASNDDIDSVNVIKGKISADGLLYDWPVTSVKDLDVLRLQCAELRDILIQLGGAFRWEKLTGRKGTRVRSAFKLADGRWQLRRRLNPPVT